MTARGVSLFWSLYRFEEGTVCSGGTYRMRARRDDRHLRLEIEQVAIGPGLGEGCLDELGQVPRNFRDRHFYSFPLLSSN